MQVFLKNGFNQWLKKIKEAKVLSSVQICQKLKITYN